MKLINKIWKRARLLSSEQRSALKETYNRAFYSELRSLTIEKAKEDAMECI